MRPVIYDEVSELLVRGFSPKQIMGKIKWAYSSLISHRRKNLGLKPFKKGFAKDLDGRKEKFRALKVSGLSYAAIAKRFKVTRQAVQLRLRPNIDNRGRCAQCKHSHNALHRHHTDYNTDAAMLLCPSCHARLHHPERKRKRYVDNSQTTITINQMKEVKVPFCQCQRCRYIWIPRAKHPKACPECKSRKWNKP